MTTVAQYSDDQARELIRTAVDQTLIVEAAAGTGKTTELVNRIVRVIAEGRADVREIVAVTFTEKAAGELKLRLRQQLERDRQTADGAAASRLSAAIQNLEEAHVSTIHGFCADLLRERPVEAGVDPLFRVLTEGQSERLFKQAFDAWLQRELAHPGEGVRRSLRRGSRGFRPGDADEDGPLERLRRAAFDLTEWRDFRGPWTREPFDRADAASKLVGLVHACADITANPSYAGDNLYVDTEPVRRLSRELRGSDPLHAATQGVESAREGGLTPDRDALEAQLIELRRNRDFKRGRKGSGPAYSKGVPRAQVLAARDVLIEALNDFQIRADADLAALLHEELLACVDEYERLKTREGALDFVDLLLRARDLIRSNGSVRSHFQERFSAIFVDEFQDTDPLQAELLLLLAASDPDEARWEDVVPLSGKLFIVGDPKQSIYRFRRADVDTYLRVCQQLERAGARRLELRKSFRGVPNIQRIVNHAFAPVMDGNPATLQAGYVPLEASRDDHPDQPSVVALPVPYPYSQRFITARKIEESLPDAVGAYIAWLVHESGWTVTERRAPATRVPLEARHICILFRRFLSYGDDVTRPYVEALEARGVRHLLVGGRTFHDREEIETLRAALMAIEWPDDQLSVFATLRGALFAIGDEELLEFYERGRSFHPFRIPEGLPPHLECVAEALNTLASLHRQRNRRPVAETIALLLEATRAHVGFVLRPGGEQALANVLHVAELARQYELDGGMSFRGFVETLHAEASVHRPAEAPILEEGSDGVRLMTVHKAKGLEFPVVILADITARLTPYDASRHIDPRRNLCALRIGGWAPKDLNDARETELLRESAEGERVAYVAATRARDLLVVPAIGDGPYTEGWISPLNRAIYPREDVRREQTPAPGCPPFKSRDTVLKRPDGDPASFLTMCPGLHRIAEGGDAEAAVVWWSPDALTLGVQAPLGLRRDDLIVKDVSPQVLRSQLDAYETWRAQRRAAVEDASKPSVHVTTATEWVRTAPTGSWPGASGPAEITVSVESAVAAGSRPGGARFGTLVHAVLADMPLAAEADVVARLAEGHGRVLAATDDEVNAVKGVARAVSRHPVWGDATRADEAGLCYREAPVTLRADDDTLIEGNVDLAFVSGDEIVVVDFKTDRELDGAVDIYTRQVQTYAAAVGGALGKKARGVLLRV
jgi:ATP-dependent exoDNAse (exonuclease V) beta subunit